MNTDEILKLIEDGWNKQIHESRKVAALQKKIADGLATYDDAQQLAMETGKILADMFRQYLPEALEDGKLYIETANRLITRPLLKNCGYMQGHMYTIQEALNQKAGIGLKPVIPDANLDQVDGIIRGITGSDPFEQVQAEFLDQVVNFMQGLVDDTARENADFHWKSGLNPVIRRTALGKCCPWCAAMAGTYNYADVSDSGNDVFRRHRNCHCTVEYDPSDGSRRRQNVYSKRWTR